MKHFILIITIILLGTFSNKSFAQSYVPEKGKVIVFYPVSDYYKQKVGGFDCFYNTSEVYKNNKTKVKPKNRFMQQNGLTPFAEIEEHTFTVVNYMVENEEAKKLEKKYFLYFLRRDDGKNVLLRIPFVHKSEDNILTHSMSVITNKYYHNYHNINIPCCIEEDLVTICRKFIGKDIIYHSSSNRKYDEEEKCKELLISNSREIQNPYNEKLYSGNDAIYHCENIALMSVKNHAFQQPIASLTLQGITYYVPIFDFRASGSSLYGMHYSFNEFYETRENLFEEKYSKISDDVKGLVGKFIVYDATWNEAERYVYAQTYKIESKQKYKFDKEARYYVEKIDFSQISDLHSYNLQAILKDDYNNRIQVPVNYLTLDKYGYYAGIFSLEEKVIARKKQKEAEAAEKDSIDNIHYHNIKKKYGNSYALYYKGLYDYQKKKFREAVAKWGPSVAKDIVEGYVRIGWNKEKCIMSWGEPKDINRSIGSWGTHEQWCYSSSYLYFENGKLTSIQN